ncbi:MAG: right-handed parallel beta-helix repeat-containing protein [Mucilaginibacter polytrichastri]|nr:right-handed parallel beta-helix repeat-containing protein [Mucilaginibacter polytrichastri]
MARRQYPRSKSDNDVLVDKHLRVDGSLWPPQGAVPSRNSEDLAGLIKMFVQNAAGDERFALVLPDGTTKYGRMMSDPVGDTLPAGGATNQVLRKRSAVSRDWEWADPTGGGDSLPAGGAAGMVLKKKSASDKDWEWGTLPDGLRAAVGTTSLSAANVVASADGGFVSNIFDTRTGEQLVLKEVTGVTVDSFRYFSVTYTVNGSSTVKQYERLNFTDPFKSVGCVNDGVANDWPLVRRCALAFPEGTELDGKNRVYGFGSNDTVNYNINWRNMQIMPLNFNQKAVRINCNNGAGNRLYWKNIRVLKPVFDKYTQTVTGTRNTGNLGDATFAMLQVNYGQNILEIDGMTANEAPKTGIFFTGHSTLDGGSLVLKNVEATDAGFLVRTTLTEAIDEKQFVINIGSTQYLTVGANVWIGDCAHQIIAINSATQVTVHNDGVKRLAWRNDAVQPNRAPSKQAAGQFFTLEKNAHCNVYIVGRSRVWTEKCKLDRGAWFGINIQATGDNAGGSLYCEASECGYEGYGNAVRSNLVFICNDFHRSGNNGLDINGCTNARIWGNNSDDGGVDGIFLGKGSNISMAFNVARGNFRLGHLINGGGPAGSYMSQVHYTNNTCTGNKQGGTNFTIARETIIKNNYWADNGSHLRVEGANGYANPDIIIIDGNTFGDGLRTVAEGFRDFYCNVKGYLAGSPSGIVQWGDTNRTTTGRMLAIESYCHINSTFFPRYVVATPTETLTVPVNTVLEIELDVRRLSKTYAKAIFNNAPPIKIRTSITDEPSQESNDYADMTPTEIDLLSIKPSFGILEETLMVNSEIIVSPNPNANFTLQVMHSAAKTIVINLVPAGSEQQQSMRVQFTNS